VRGALRFLGWFWLATIVVAILLSLSESGVFVGSVV
jgi:hypothetical protein